MPITRRRSFELLVGNYLSMPTGKGSFSKIELYANVFTQKLWGFKLKTTTGRDTVNSLRQISQAFVALTTFMTDGRPPTTMKYVPSATRLGLVCTLSQLIHHGSMDSWNKAMAFC